MKPTSSTRAAPRSPVAVARKALTIGQAALPAYSSKFPRKDFTQPQLFGGLVLMRFFGTDYRGITASLHDLADLRQTLELTEKTPHCSTLCYADQRLGKARPSPPF
jgi:hypothetical protein